MDDMGIERLLSVPSQAIRSSKLRSLLDSNDIDRNIVEVLIKIDNVGPNITDYRDRERYLEDLSKLVRQDGPSKSEQTHRYVFRYLLGSLYVNFERFWGPTIRVATEILNQSKYKAGLLSLLLDHLKETNDIIYDAIDCTGICAVEDRPDHILHRNFIFQLLAKFPEYVESHNYEFMEQFFRFVHKEMLVSPFIEKCTRSDLSLTEVRDESDHGDIDSIPDDGNSRSLGGNQSERSCKFGIQNSLLQKRKTRETFITLAKIIQPFENITKIHRQAELKDFLMNLLCCRDSSVQKATFNCLLAFERDNIQPYISKIQRIMSDKKVRSELTTFSLDEEKGLIPEEYRKHLVPILLRVLFGKMIGKIGKQSHGKDKSDLRKTLVMRFVATCTTEEILSFFDILFDPLFRLAYAPFEELKLTLERDLNIKSYIPINKLQAMLSSLSAFINSVAHLREDTLPYVFKMINIITFITVKPLEQREILEKLSHKSIESLRALRRECTNVLTEFFRTFEYYRYSQDELDFMFKNLLWPSTRGFIDKNHATITPLLRLIETISSNQALHKLLIKRNKSDKTEYLLHHVVDLYSDSRTKRPVLKFIASILANILQPTRSPSENDEGHEDEFEEPDANSGEFCLVDDLDAIIPEYERSFYKNVEGLPLNQEILVGFIPAIFGRLKTVCEQFVEKKDNEHRVERDELLVLSTLSSFLKDSEQSLLGTKLLLSTLAHQKKADLILDTLKTAQTLMKQVEKNNDPDIILNIANTLSYQHNTAHRRELCILVGIIANIDARLVATSEILELMNFASEEFVDAPDLVKWNEGFQKAFDFLDSLDKNKMNEQDSVKESMILMVHQVNYIISSVDRYEFSIRENCIIFYEKLANKLKLVECSSNGQLLHQLLDEIILEKFIKKGLRETNDTIKHTYIAIVRSLAIQCHAKNTKLHEFNLFCNKSEELDFWFNIRHIQLHNRSKALARLVASEELGEVSAKTLSAYFMPLATGFLFSKNFKSVSSLSENAIKLIGLICKHLNWVTYESTLSYYLGLLTKANTAYQKTNIKLITEIIKNFNFDLRACEEALQYEQENSKLERRMKKRLGANQDFDNFEAIAAEVPSGKRLNPSTARMVYHAVTKKLIPRLSSCFHEMTSVEFEHDKNMAGYLPEKEEIKRIPMAYAIVQLLNLLPGRYVLLRDQLPATLLKLTSFLKSKNEQVRKAARLTLCKVMCFVGPAYLPDMLRVLKQNLDKGFQIHVLNFTIHSVLNKIPLHYGDLDQSINELVNSCMQEIFGKPSEDKEILQILAKTPEAKKTKSYDTLLIISSHVSAEKLNFLMQAIKDLLKTCNEPRKVNKLSQCLQRIFTGLSRNDSFPLEKLFGFIHSTIQDSIPGLKIRQASDNSMSERPKLPLREDRFLIEKDAPRERVKSKINEMGNYHMIVENSLRLLLLALEKNKSLIKQKESLKQKLDTFIQLLSACLKSSSPRCVMRSLKCIYFIAQAKSNLPTFKTKCNSIVRKIFILLNLYNGVGMVQGDNFEMIAMCFKTLTLLLLRCEQAHLNNDQVRALLSYIEQDIHDSNRQATAFATLHSLLQKGCNSPELSDIMDKVADLLVTSDDESVRTLSIKSWRTYLLNYNHEGKSLQAHLTRFMRQIDYEHIDGRESVLKMLQVVIREFPENLLRDYFQLIFQLLAQRVVNEESKDVRTYLSKLIGALFARLPDQQTYLLNKFVFPWASNENLSLKLLGIKLISIIIESCISSFQSDRGRIRKTLAILADALEMTEAKKKSNDANVENNAIDLNPMEGIEESNQELSESAAPVKLIALEDKLNYHSLRLFQRLIRKELTTCTESRYIVFLKRIWQSISAHKMSNWYLPVVLTSCQLYVVFIRSTKLGDALNVGEPQSDNYIDWNAKRIVRTLCDKFIELLDRCDESDELRAYVTESMILLGQFVANSNATLEFEKAYSESFDCSDIVGHLLNLKDLPSDGFAKDHLPCSFNESKKNLNLMWLSVKIAMQARKEAALFRLSKYHRRDFVLRWTAAISQELGQQRILPYVFLYTMTPVRELSDKVKGKTNNDSTSGELLLMSEDLLKFLKTLTGVEIFNKIYSRVQLHYTKRRIDRKKIEAVIKVRDQARGVKRQMKKRKAKDSNRKRYKRG